MSENSENSVAAPSTPQERRSRWMMLLLISLGLVVAALLALGLGWRYYQGWLHTPMNHLEVPREFYVKPGDSLASVGRKLAADGVLTHPELLRVYARLETPKPIHKGEYRLEGALTPQQLIDKLVAGDVVVHQVTLIEGWTIKQFLQALSAHTTIEHTLQGVKPEAIAELLDIEGHPEGWLYPDTYVFERGTKDRDILLQAHARMKKLLDEQWQNRAKDLPYKTPYEALIMASIIERETGHADERPDIAGVFVRRLKLGMKLQTDPTVIYGMGDRFQGKITRADLQEATAHNTYVIDGLPPTPISNPSLAALRAALHPAAGESLYFVAKGDGTSYFSKTLDEHNQAVRRYQLKRRADYRAAPPPASAPAAP